MAKVDRSQWRVRKFEFGDPEEEFDPAIEQMSIAERMALVYEASRRLLEMQGTSFDECRLPRHAMRIEKRAG
jgi:hypothetical protein